MIKQEHYKIAKLPAVPYKNAIKMDYGIRQSGKK